MSNAAAGMIYQPVFQMGYVTEDLDQAIELFSERYTISEFYRTPEVTMNAVGAGDMKVKIGLAWNGPTMIEIICLLGGDDQLYRQVLPDRGFAVRFHHIAIRLHSDAEWDAMLAQARKANHKTVLQVQVPSTRALYLDTRNDLGHYLEYLYYHDPENSSLPRIPQNFA